MSTNKKIVNYRIDNDVALGFEAIASSLGRSATAQVELLMRNFIKDNTPSVRGTHKVELTDVQVKRLKEKNINKKFVNVK